MKKVTAIFTLLVAVFAAGCSSAPTKPPSLASTLEPKPSLTRAELSLLIHDQLNPWLADLAPKHSANKVQFIPMDLVNRADVDELMQIVGLDLPVLQPSLSLEHQAQLFQVNKLVTRAELAQIVAALLKRSQKQSSHSRFANRHSSDGQIFVDVPSTAPVYAAIVFVTARQLIPVENDHFYPSRTVRGGTATQAVRKIRQLLLTQQQEN